jgi:threonylcarbamoyladenosine tRNA methylthiotransferase MtaB
MLSLLVVRAIGKSFVASVANFFQRGYNGALRMENQVKFLSLGCRLNSLEAEKIKVMLNKGLAGRAIVVNTCAVTAEAERQSRQAIRKLVRENPGIPVFVTGCAATRAPEDYAKIPGVAAVVPNKDKLNPKSYEREEGGEVGEVGGRREELGVRLCRAKRDEPLMGLLRPSDSQSHTAPTPTSSLLPPNSPPSSGSLSKFFVQIQNGCNHSCSYCIVSKLRGKSVSFSYDRILAEVRAATEAGFSEIVLTGVDIAGYVQAGGFFLASLCERLLRDVPGLRRLRLSSMDPASPECAKIISLMEREPRMLPHLHLSMQSGSDRILAVMGRRHSAEMVRRLILSNRSVSFGWDIICGFPGETPELFAETCALVKELKPINIHAFPFSPRPGTLAAEMPGQVGRPEAKRRVGIVAELAQENRRSFMRGQIGRTAGVLMESGNIGRTQDDIPIRVGGAPIAPRTVADIFICGESGGFLTGLKSW